MLEVETIAVGLTNLNPVKVVFSDELSALVTLTLKKSVKVVLLSVNVPLELMFPLGVPLPLIDTALFEALINQFAVALVLLKETVMLAPVVVLSAAVIPVALVELSVTLKPEAAVPPPAC